MMTRGGESRDEYWFKKYIDELKTETVKRIDALQSKIDTSNELIHKKIEANDQRYVKMFKTITGGMVLMSFLYIKESRESLINIATTLIQGLLKL